MKAAKSPGTLRKPANPGIVTGLALTRTGATAATVECLPLPGRGKIILTGNLVGSARDAAHIAVSLARARAKKLGLDPALFLHTDLHFHVMDPLPQKGGPSIGLPLFVALVSALTRKPVDPTFAFTGELSLTGRVLAVEGILAKAKAAAKAGVRKLFSPVENVAELGEKKLKELAITATAHVDNALEIVFSI
jgi:ATP-dependent Lon protease